VANSRYPIGPLLALTLGVAGWVSPASAAAPSPASAEIRDGILVTADRLSDAATTEKVETALRQDPFIFSDHVTVSTRNGIVRLTGRTSDLPDLFRILRLARHIAGKGKVANEIEYVPISCDAD
jgi:osmotically-inducible protein OsmY